MSAFTITKNELKNVINFSSLRSGTLVEDEVNDSRIFQLTVIGGDLTNTFAKMRESID